MKLETRAITSSDYNYICSWPQSAEELFYLAPYAQFPWPTDDFADALGERVSNMVFTIDRQPVGFANFYNVEPEAKGFIGNVVVDPQHRRRGLGKQIIRHMLKIGFTLHYFKEIHLSCFSNNTPALLMYRKLGFQPYELEQRSDHNNRPVALIHFLFTQQNYMDKTTPKKLNKVMQE